MSDDAGRAARDRALFERIARSYCRKDLAPAQRIARAHRLDQTFALASVPREARCLEVGCGAGYAATYLAGRYSRYVGIDQAEALIAYARAHNAAPGVSFEAVDVAAYSSNERFDVVFMIGVLHHLSDPAAALLHVRSLLAPGGLVLVNEPQPANPLIRVARSLRTVVDRDYSAEQVQYSADELRAMLDEAGFTRLTVKPQGLLSTPFAEVVTPLQACSAPLSRLCCRLDALLERHAPGVLVPLSWNLVAAGHAD